MVHLFLNSFFWVRSHLFHTLHIEFFSFLYNFSESVDGIVNFFVCHCHREIFFSWRGVRNFVFHFRNIRCQGRIFHQRKQSHVFYRHSSGFQLSLVGAGGRTKYFLLKSCHHYSSFIKDCLATFPDDGLWEDVSCEETYKVPGLLIIYDCMI